MILKLIALGIIAIIILSAVVYYYVLKPKAIEIGKMIFKNELDTSDSLDKVPYENTSKLINKFSS